MRYGYLSVCLSLGLTVQGQAVWQQFSSAPAAGRFWAAATGNSTHGYAGTGRLQFSGTGNEVADMYEYEAATDTWTAIPDYPGGVRAGVDGFTIGERIFFAFGSPFIQFTSTVYEYIPATQSWTQHPDVPGGVGFAYSHGFVIGDTYYIGPENGTNNVYAFNGTTNTWSSVASFPGADRRAQCAFSANGKGYLGMGAGVFSGVFGDWWEYDPVADSWTEVASVFPNADQACATAVNNVGYLYNTGGSGGGGKQLFNYDATADQWNSDAILPTDRIANASAMTIGNHGYIVFGESTLSGGNQPSNQLWRFTPGSTGITGLDAFSDIIVTANFTGSILVQVPDAREGSLQIDVIDSHGRTLATGSIRGAGVIEVGSDLAAGAYLVTFRGERISGTRKVVMVR
ncbi:MAG: hypothetical protein KDB88_11675 [Flavobacteriales bacterium]|nr:hypothetical protein [Flavobacteriales bacterium]